MFSRYLWGRIFKTWEPRLIVAIGHEAYSFAGEFFGYAYRAEKEHPLPAHRENRYNKWMQFTRPDGKRITLAGFPHFAYNPAFTDKDGQYPASCDFLREVCKEFDGGTK